MSIADKRPLSPHLQIYRWQISSVLSILHRLTGVALAFGSALLVAWLWATAYNLYWHDRLYMFLASPIGLTLLAGWTFAFYFHLCNGIRHLFWDMGYGFTIPVFTRTGWAVVILSLVLTVGTWYCAIHHGMGL